MRLSWNGGTLDGKGEAVPVFVLEACVYAEVLCQKMLTLRMNRGNM
jgi:hypothetical protein